VTGKFLSCDKVDKLTGILSKRRIKSLRGDKLIYNRKSLGSVNASPNMFRSYEEDEDDMDEDLSVTEPDEDINKRELKV
jgi:hypothetical protein